MLEIRNLTAGYDGVPVLRDVSVAVGKGELVGLHITPGRLRPVFLTTPGTYCVVARDHLIGTRLLRRAEGAQT